MEFIGESNQKNTEAQSTFLVRACGNQGDKKKALPAATISGICDLLIKQLLVSFPKGASPARPQEIRSIPGFSTEIAILVKTQGR